MDLATSENNTFLMVTSLAIQDLAGLNVNSVTRQVANFTGDDSSNKTCAHHNVCAY